MLKITPLSSLVFVVGIAAAGFACSSGGTEDKTVIVTPAAGTGAVAMGGSGNSGGTGTAVPTAGTSPTPTGGTGNGQAGSQTAAGSGGMIGSMGGTGGGSTGGTGTGGSTGGTGTGGGGGGGSGEAGKVVLYDGTADSFKAWYPRNGKASDPNPWTNNADGTMTVKGGTGDIISKQAFQDVFLHVEYKNPPIVGNPADLQARGNSGVYLKGSYELQVLDTFGLEPMDDGCGAIYKIAKPLVTACKKDEQWNTYEIEFKANACANGAKTGNAVFPEVKLNTMVVHTNVTAGRTTEGGLPETCEPRGVLLQDHYTQVPVTFRNIWVIPRK